MILFYEVFESTNCEDQLLNYFERLRSVTSRRWKWGWSSPAVSDRDWSCVEYKTKCTKKVLLLCLHRTLQLQYFTHALLTCGKPLNFTYKQCILPEDQDLVAVLIFYPRMVCYLSVSYCFGGIETRLRGILASTIWPNQRKLGKEDTSASSSHNKRG